MLQRSTYILFFLNKTVPVQLATSHYAIVRIRAQETIQHMTSHHAYSYKILLDPLLQLLSSENSEEKVSHEAFKG